MNPLQAALHREATCYGLTFESPASVRLSNGAVLAAQARIGSPDADYGILVFTDGELDRAALKLLVGDGVSFSVLSMPSTPADYEDCREMFADWGLLNS